jgi:amino acid adenylation domain-containing protein/non-ribosomal peptide synthase protein (TIGR01720 family)
VWQDEHVTYQALNRRANQLAFHLQGLGVRPETLVGLCVERSPDMVVGILGILKAGGAYVPLDPAYPAERLAYMLKDAQVALLLTQERLVERLPSYSARIVRLDADWARISPASDENPARDVTLDNLAYAIYTSGSTGVPKGVLLHHRGLYNVSQAQLETFALTSADRVLQFASLSFDASVFEIVMALRVGATLCLGSPESLLPGPDFAHLLRNLAVTAFTLTPSGLSLLPVRELPNLSIVGVGGEACPEELVARWAGGRRFFNLYGPTEGTIWATVALCDEHGQKPPIGRPIANTQTYVLGARQQPLPVGAPGELYIGGVGLARGYLNRPALTAERFVPDPFSPPPAGGTERGRLYRTGDLARYRPDGNIEFLGRVDHQVKVRGFRIELGEIEAVLRGYPAVHETTVLARDDGSSGRRLVAYVVPSDKASVSHPAPFVSELRSYLRGKLPDYMLPAVFVSLAALPRSPSGKIDRRALPAPEGERPELEAFFVAPRTRIEETLAEIWAEVLGLERVGVHDSFFELGGDSILSVQLVARANQAGLQFTPKHLFENQTIAQLADVADATSLAPTEQDLVTGPVPLTPIQQWFFEQDLPAPHHFNQALLLQAQRPLDAALLERAFEQLLVHHDALRLRFERQPSGWQQSDVLPDGSVPFTWIDLTALSEAPGPALEAAAAQLQASLNLERGPLARMAFFELGVAVAGRLLVVIHHLAVDGVSWRILLQDLWTVYQQLERGDEVQLPPKTTSFQQWAERLVAYARAGELQYEIGYWTAEPRAQVSHLPLDHDTGDDDVASSATVSVSLSAQETHALLHEVPSAYHTHINDVLLTALAQAFVQWTGVPSLLVDLESHGRETPFEDLDLSRTVGWFTSVAPLLLDLSAAWQPGEALMSIKEQLRRVPVAGFGYGLLRFLGQDEDVAARLRALPQAEVSFNYLGQIELGFSTALPFQLAPEWAGPPHDLQARRRYLLEVNGSVAAGQLQFGWRYSQNRHRRSTVEQLARAFIASLQALIAHCQSPQAGGRTVSDFPAAEGLNRQELDELLAEFGEFAGD